MKTLIGLEETMYSCTITNKKKHKLHGYFSAKYKLTKYINIIILSSSSTVFISKLLDISRSLERRI